jgi:hypothetical protein
MAAMPLPAAAEARMPTGVKILFGVMPRYLH